MPTLLTLMAGICLSWATPPEPVAGSWWIKGHETYGALVIQVAPEGAVTGTIYDQPIRGSFARDSGELQFTRYSDREATRGVQTWSGKLARVAGSQPPTYTLRGTFASIAGPQFGQPDQQYPWGGQAIRHPLPAVDLEQLQGDWTVAGVIACSDPQVALPKSAGLAEKGQAIQLRGNQILRGGQPVAVVANDLDSQSLAKEVGFSDYRLMLLTLPDGRGMLCSYLIKAEGVEIAYPHTTSCHRGSGQVIYLRREGK
jgi:hypothetical protein